MQHKPLETGFYGATHNLKIQILKCTGLGFNIRNIGNSIVFVMLLNFNYNTDAGNPNGICFSAKVYRSGNAQYGLLINSSHNFDLYSKTTNQ